MWMTPDAQEHDKPFTQANRNLLPLIARGDWIGTPSSSASWARRRLPPLPPFASQTTNCALAAPVMEAI